MKRVLSLLLAAVLVLGLWGPVPAKAVTGGKLVALTFDDGPGRDTARLLDGLKERNVKCTFFYVGQQLKRFPGIAERAYREGHELANHSYSHPNLKKLSDSEVLQEIQSVNDILRPICGEGTRILVRAPGGNSTEHTRAVANVPFIYWSTNTSDYIVLNGPKVRDALVSTCFDGAILLLHDSHSTSVDAALMGIDLLKEQGYEFVTVSELFRRRGVPLVNGKSHVSCKPTGTDLGPVQAPTFSTQIVNGQIKVTLTAQEGAQIYYSLTGSELNGNSKKYTGPFLVTPPCTVWAEAAFDMNGSRSEIVSQEFQKVIAQAPVLKVQNGMLSMTTATPGAKMYYTLDGSTATESSTPYTKPVRVTPGTVIQACAGGKNYIVSPVSKGTVITGGRLFQDLFPTQWFYTDVNKILNTGIMKGTGTTTFEPDRIITWGEMLTVLYRLSGDTVTRSQRNKSPLPAKDQAQFYGDAAVWALDKYLISYNSQTPAILTWPIARQDLARLLVDYAQTCHKVLPEASDEAEKYADGDTIASWLQGHVSKAAAYGLMQGDEHGMFLPLEGTTRAQAACVLNRLTKLLKEAPDVV